ncbi:MAG: hypothetical protein K0U59_10965 [Gammaproteobacteria bacterium]|nr:hypothetical protein [Gammaproteobacteria bacterium]
MQKSTGKYLQHYAEPETAALTHWPGNRFTQLLVIPAYRESKNFLVRIKTQFCGQKILLILVVNQPDNDSSEQESAQLVKAANESQPCSWQHENLSLYLWGGNCATLLVQRWQLAMRIPHKQGVGLARKIGADIACWLITHQFINSEWIHSSDADAELPQDYFQQLPAASTNSAALYPFFHSGGSAATNTAVTLYEQALHLYVEGLRHAGSPWAFHTIGSILAISASFYAKARGFPKRSAGEDFYLLNKLGKLAPIIQLQNRQSIRLQARLSDRVPFGTGPSTAKIARQLQTGEEPLWYAPEVFQQLREFLHCATNQPPARLDQNPYWSSALEQLSWKTFIGHCQRQKLNGQNRITALHHWFDAFRTLRFIHLMQQQWYPPIPLRTLIQQKNQIQTD